MEFIYREFNGSGTPLPPKWKPGDPLPKNYKIKHLYKIENKIEWNYRDGMKAMYTRFHGKNEAA